jgi:hypothetical protein
MLDTTRRKAAEPIPARELGGSAYGAKIDCVFVTPWPGRLPCDEGAGEGLKMDHHADTIERARAMLVPLGEGPPRGPFRMVTRKMQSARRSSRASFKGRHDRR